MNPPFGPPPFHLLWSNQEVAVVNITLIIAICFIVLLSGILIYILVQKKSGANTIFKAKQESKALLDNAKDEADKKRREVEIETKEKLINLKSDFERQTRERRHKFNETERRLVKK